MKNRYRPVAVVIESVERHSPTVKLFRLARADGRPFPRMSQSKGRVFVPGQFVLAGLWGYGEAPFGLASDPANAKYLDIIVRKAGVVTTAMHALRKGEKMTLRGPYGNGYPMDFFRGKDLLFVTGGCGMPPIAALIREVIASREDYGSVHLVYGAATPDELLLKRELKHWGKDIGVLLTIDRPVKGWKGRTGFVSAALPDVSIEPARTAVAMCGPGPMVDAIEHLLNDRGVPDRRIFISMERRMQCGVGRCQHCVTGTSYVCTDGPVFNLDEIDRNWD